MSGKERFTPVITWRNPPPDDVLRGIENDWGYVAARLKKNPNRWAEVAMLGRVSTTIAAHIKGTSCAYSAFLPRGSFDAVARNGRLFVCYIGGQEVTCP